jgi:hypothetical protein
MTGTRIIIAGALILAAMICLSGCISPPGKNTGTMTAGDTTASQGSGVMTTPTGTQAGDGSGPTPAASPAPGEAGYLTPATPFPTATTPASNYAGTRLPDAPPVPTKYMAIYYDILTPKNNRTAYTYELYRPPLLIELCFSPNMTSRTIWYESDYGQHEEKTETVTSISPYAWFKVIVRDAVSGEVIAEDGYSRGYSVEPGKDLTIRSPGKYLIEFSGNELSAEIQVSVPEEGNPGGSPLRDMSCA